MKKITVGEQELRDYREWLNDELEFYNNWLADLAEEYLSISKRTEVTMRGQARKRQIGREFDRISEEIKVLRKLRNS
ncbi:hypothetical protein [Vibrio sp. 10N.261.49.C12]|uniref:hypothetical protein n=1 Tax=Vibrio sp. 10N.261.49.C12 TaxID=3229671 RepID=UPI0035526989